MSERADLLRVDSTGTVHPVGRVASQELRARVGEWRLVASPTGVMLVVPAGEDAPVIKLAGEIRTPGALADVVALIAQSAWSGELVVYGESSHRAFYFEAGSVIGAHTNVKEERLGETLWRFGVINREQLDAALEVAESSGIRLGEAAVELEFVKPEDLYPMMARQIEEVFYGALQVSEGAFYFFDRFDETKLARRHNINSGALLMEGARRMDEMRFFREKVPNDTYIPVRKNASDKVPEDTTRVYDQIDGKRSIEEIGRETGQLEFEVTRAVFQLVRGGFVYVLAPRPKGPEAVVECVNPALVLVHKRCDAVGKGGDLRDGLSRFATGAGVFDPLFMGAGPQKDGSFKPDRVARNLAVLAGDDPDNWLIQQLLEYVGFALFQASSLLPREEEVDLSNAVAELLKPIRSPETSPPPGTRKG
ncbi:MAG: DUF4388 domain-containing protein [Polyangiaceae bacterium]